jgi:hypothetical protein
MRPGVGLVFIGTLAALAAVPGRAAARPDVFAEGIVGVAFALGASGYSEEHEDLAVQAGVRGGVWFAPGRIENQRAQRGKRVGLELQVDRASYHAGYFYYQDVSNPDGTTSTVRVDPEYSRVRLLGGVRVAMPMHRYADLILRAAGGVDRVTGSAEGIAPLVEVGFQLSFHLGIVRIGVDGAVAAAFHDNEVAQSGGIGPQFGHRPGYGQAVDALGCVTIGAVF